MIKLFKKEEIKTKKGKNTCLFSLFVSCMGSESNAGRGPGLNVKR